MLLLGRKLLLRLPLLRVSGRGLLHLLVPLLRRCWKCRTLPEDRRFIRRGPAKFLAKGIKEIEPAPVCLRYRHVTGLQASAYDHSIPGNQFCNLPRLLLNALNHGSQAWLIFEVLSRPARSVAEVGRYLHYHLVIARHGNLLHALEQLGSQFPPGRPDF